MKYILRGIFNLWFTLNRTQKSNLVMWCCVADHPSTVSGIKRRCVSFYACRDTQRKRMIAINLCVLLGLSRGNQSWLNCAMTSISARENSSCYLIWLHNRGAHCLESMYFILVKWRNATFLWMTLFHVSVTKKYTHAAWYEWKCSKSHTCIYTCRSSDFTFNITLNTSRTIPQKNK